MVRRIAPNRNGRAVFPIGGAVALVAEQFAHGANLRDDVGAFLVVPLVMASPRQGLLWCVVSRF